MTLVLEYFYSTINLHDSAKNQQFNIVTLTHNNNNNNNNNSEARRQRQKDNRISNKPKSNKGFCVTATGHRISSTPSFHIIPYT
mmetsp:Transcript_48247/g.71928  ORF Transcript_48247/g.71928 Transcript_48247/m.71928 type:complete len:84 (-) Transcript_48247:75-326(-)